LLRREIVFYCAISSSQARDPHRMHDFADLFGRLV
jgi:hypothetical protein